MYFIICVTILLHKFHTIKADHAFEDEISQVHVSDIAEEFIALFDKHIKEKERIKELKDKLVKIDNYGVDRDKYLKRIKLVLQLTHLNATNFYDALKGQDAFKDFRNESKSLYLKMKEKMNRDDLLAILSDRGKKTIKKYARRMMRDSYRPSKQKEMAIDEAVDKYLGEKVVDDHTFEEEKFSKFWDPAEEMRDRLAKKSGRRIYKGERSTIIYYPFVVSLHIMGRFWCGGAIYWVDLVITSASCLQLMHNNRFYRENPKALQVRVGSNHSRIGGEVVDALEVFFHPAYDPKSLRNNIAVVRLRRQLKFTYHRIPKMIEISTQGQGVPMTATILLLGWGVTKTNQKLAYEPIFLQTKELPIYPNKFCQEVYGSQFVTSSMFCAGTLTTGEGACDHDAGGPAVLNGKLVGIISFGPTVCGYPNAPTVFTLVGAHADWIETVNETMPEYYRGKAGLSTTKIDDKLLMTLSDRSYEAKSIEHSNKKLRPLKRERAKKKRSRQTLATQSPEATIETQSPLTTQNVPSEQWVTPMSTPSQPPPTQVTPKQQARTPLETTTEDMYIHLPPGAFERSKYLNQSDTVFQINPVAESDGQVGMFVDARRERHKSKGKKKRGRKRKSIE